MRTRPVLALLVLASAACATSPSHKSEPTLNDALLQQRAKALEALAVTALRPCVDKLKPEVGSSFHGVALEDGMSLPVAFAKPCDPGAKGTPNGTPLSYLLIA